MVSDGDPLDNGVFETQTLNVGQADARVSITEEGEIILVDANTEKVAEELDAVLAERSTPRTADGKTPIDHLVVTHLHDDHVKGIDSLQDGYEIQHVIEPDDSRYEVCDSTTGEPEGRVGENVMKTYTNALENHNVETISQVSAGEEMFPHSNTDATALGPPDTNNSVDVTRASTGASVNFKAIQANENGAVFKIEGERSALFMGDVQDDYHHYAESWLMQQHDDPESDIDLDADVLFVGHHGSGNATSDEFLNRVGPRRARTPIASHSPKPNGGFGTQTLTSPIRSQSSTNNYSVNHSLRRPAMAGPRTLALTAKTNARPT
jgi:competence protein ComEC